MVFEYILKMNGIDPTTDLTIIQNIDFGVTAEAFVEALEIIQWNLNLMRQALKKMVPVMLLHLLVWIRAMCRIPVSPPLVLI